MRSAIALVVLSVLAAAARPVAAQELGRLFFTPEQRDALDARRRARLPDAPVAATPSRSTRIDGYVMRSGGKSTVWVNGEPVAEGSPADEVRAFLRRDDPGRVSLSVGGGGPRVNVNIGATLDHGSGEARDLIGNGRIRVRR
jgi:hypothetical protein